MAYEVSGLGVCGRLLVETLDGRHLFSLLERLEALGQPDHAPVDADQAAGQAAAEQASPGADQLAESPTGESKESRRRG